MNGESSLDGMIKKESIWLLYPGATLEPACGSTENALHFTGMAKKAASG